MLIQDTEMKNLRDINEELVEDNAFTKPENMSGLCSNW